MNLSSFPIRISSASIQGGPYDSITVKIQVSDDGGNTYSDFYVADVVSVSGVYFMDLVPILASRFVPNIPATSGSVEWDNHAFWFKVIGISPDGLYSSVFEESRFWYSIDDSDAVNRNVKKFIPNKQFPVSVWNTPITIVVDGVSGSYSNVRAGSMYVYPSTSLVINGESYSVSDCSTQLSFINRHGVWDVMVMEGNTYRSDNVSKDMVSVLSDVAYHRNVKMNVPYAVKITPSYVLNTGWMTESEAAVFVQDVLESPVLFIQDVNSGLIQGERCYVDDGSVSYLKHTRDDLMQYSFSVTCSRPLVKY